MLELLAPAGSMEALRAAVQNGASAVYLGCGAFNARQSAKNFTPQTLVEAIKYCHVRGVQVHLTLNTLVSDREMTEAAELIRYAAQNNIDAFIVQDLGVVQLCRQIAPGVPIHGSTQMTVHSLPGVLLCAAMGIKRVVLSRELSREEIRYICANSPIEIEVFVHGALCMCYSGQCYMSAMIGGRSGNRGRCAQPCRQSYGYTHWQEKYPLSLKDNCLIPYLRELQEMGVVSLKLEGRMKRAEYGATVTAVYRKALDEMTVTKPMMDALYAAFNRQGFTDGYYTSRVDTKMFGVRQENDDDGKWLQAARQSYEAGETPLVDIRFQAMVTVDGSCVIATDPEGRTCRSDGPVPERAQNISITGAMLAQRVSKTGGTPYRCVEVRTRVDPGLIISASAIPGNEVTVGRVINELFRKGADVVYDKADMLHVSGHACQEELKIIHALTKPKYFIPVHGEQRMLQIHKNLAMSMGMDRKNIAICENGDAVEITARTMKLVPGMAPAGEIFVDGSGVGDVGAVVLRDRKHLAEDGMVVVVLPISAHDGYMLAEPEIITRGFIYVKESEELMNELKTVVMSAAEGVLGRRSRDIGELKGAIKSGVSNYLFKTTKRSPMVIPVITKL